MKTQSALPWFGSDSEVAEELGAMFDDCRHVTIPFCGGLGILPYLKAKAIVANDKHEDAINFYRVASGVHGVEAQGDLFFRCQKTLSHPAEMARALEWLDQSPVGRAWSFWAICWLGRKGKGGTKNQGGKPSIRRTADGGSNATRLRAAADDLQEWAEKHFIRCEWESDDFRIVIPKVPNKKGCGLYIDAPWDGPGEGYRHGFKEQDHRDLRLHVAHFTDTKVVVRYGDTPLIRELYSDWNILEATSRDQANQTKPELWITNAR